MLYAEEGERSSNKVEAGFLSDLGVQFVRVCNEGGRWIAATTLHCA